MTQRTINSAIRALAIAASIAVAFTACESATEPTTQRQSTPRTVSQLVVGTWMQDAVAGQAQYFQFLSDGTAAVWAESETVMSQDDLVFDLNW